MKVLVDFLSSHPHYSNIDAFLTYFVGMSSTLPTIDFAIFQSFFILYTEIGGPFIFRKSHYEKQIFALDLVSMDGKTT